jgi:hypothetical protein
MSMTTPAMMMVRVLVLLFRDVCHLGEWNDGNGGESLSYNMTIELSSLDAQGGGVKE